VDVQAVGIDGFHYPRSVLDSRHVETDLGRVPLASVKGAPETFDVVALERQLRASGERELIWPEYDRRVHDVVPGREPVCSSLVLVEGNWLLLDEPGWSHLTEHSVYNVFIEAEPALLRDRLIDRKVRGGMGRDEAAAFYERSDRRNIERVLARTDRSKVDLLLHLNPETTTTSGGVR
jgi:pantothenate kinase